MLKTPQKPNRKINATSEKVAVIKNGHTVDELKDMGERWVNYQGPYLTLAEVITIERAKQTGAKQATQILGYPEVPARAEEYRQEKAHLRIKNSRGRQSNLAYRLQSQP